MLDVQECWHGGRVSSCRRQAAKLPTLETGSPFAAGKRDRQTWSAKKKMGPADGPIK